MTNDEDTVWQKVAQPSWSLQRPQGLTATYTAPASTLGPWCSLTAEQSHSQVEPQGLWGINMPA